jgi:hypothetical protein
MQLLMLKQGAQIFSAGLLGLNTVNYILVWQTDPPSKEAYLLSWVIDTIFLSAVDSFRLVKKSIFTKREFPITLSYKT